MAKIWVDRAELVVTPEPNEKRWGFLSDLRVPLGSISAVEVVDDGRSATRGIRAPGLGGSARKIGTWRSKGDKQYVCVRRGQPAVKVTIAGAKFQTILVGADDAELVAEEIRTAISKPD